VILTTNKTGDAMDTIKVECWSCSDTHNIRVKPSDYKEWQEGELIQDVLYYLTEDERELLISRTCGECWDELFGVDEEDEEITDDDLIWEE